MLPPAPCRFSISTGWPSASDTFCPTTRAMTSTGPPGACAARNRMGLAGYSSAAPALDIQLTPASANPPTDNSLNILRMKAPLLSDGPRRHRLDGGDHVHDRGRARRQGLRQ